MFQHRAHSVWEPLYLNVSTAFRSSFCFNLSFITKFPQAFNVLIRALVINKDKESALIVSELHRKRFRKGKILFSRYLIYTSNIQIFKLKIISSGFALGGEDMACFVCLFLLVFQGVCEGRLLLTIFLCLHSTEFSFSFSIIEIPLRWYTSIYV